MLTCNQLHKNNLVFSVSKKSGYLGNLGGDWVTVLEYDALSTWIRMRVWQVEVIEDYDETFIVMRKIAITAA